MMIPRDSVLDPNAFSARSSVGLQLLSYKPDQCGWLGREEKRRGPRRRWKLRLPQSKSCSRNIARLKPRIHGLSLAFTMGREARSSVGISTGSAHHFYGV